MLAWQVRQRRNWLQLWMTMSQSTFSRRMGEGSSTSCRNDSSISVILLARKYTYVPFRLSFLFPHRPSDNAARAKILDRTACRNCQQLDRLCNWIANVTAWLYSSEPVLHLRIRVQHATVAQGTNTRKSRSGVAIGLWLGRGRVTVFGMDWAPCAHAIFSTASKLCCFPNHRLPPHRTNAFAGDPGKRSGWGTRTLGTGLEKEGGGLELHAD